MMPSKRFLGIRLDAVLAIGILFFFSACSQREDPPAEVVALIDNGHKPPPPLARAVVAEMPLPQDPVKQRLRRAERAKWELETTLGAYERAGQKDPKWDAAARKALRAAAAYWNEPMRFNDERIVAWKAAQEAIDGGCDDPMILYLHARLGVDWQAHGTAGLHHLTKAEHVRLLAQAADALGKSDYPAVRKASAEINASAHLIDCPSPDAVDPDWPARVQRRLENCLALIPEILKDGTVDGRAQAIDLARLYHANMVNLHKKTVLVHDKGAGVPDARKAALDRLALTVGGNPEWRAVLLCILGEGYVAYGWDARGTGWAHTVAPERRALFEERLRQAEAYFLQAWAADASLAEAAAGMITVAMALGRDREEMEVWFRRALEADGKNWNACLRKLTYLEPKWFGSEEDVLAFGHACLATNNWEDGVPLILVEAHLRLASYAQPEHYLQRPDVWEDIQTVYESFLKHRPEVKGARAVYARLACRSGRFDKADELFQTLGEDDWLGVFSSGEEYQQMKRQAQQARDKK